MTATRLALKQGGDDWLAARRQLITATDLPVLMGLSPYKSESQLADQKSGTAEPEASSLPMRVGLALEGLIRDEYTSVTGRKLRRFHGLVVHPTITWAAASPDYSVVGERRLVEAKWTSSAGRFEDGLPQDIEVQCAWQLGVMGYETVDVAALIGGRELRVFTVEHDPKLFDGLVTIAEDFRRRLAEGGPFAESAASVKARWPADNGAEMVADEELTEAVERLLAVREHTRQAEAEAEALETAIKSRMADAAVLAGRGWRVSWKRTKDVATTDWKSLADGLLRQLPDEQREPLVGIHTTVRPGFRPFRVVREKGQA